MKHTRRILLLMLAMTTKSVFTLTAQQTDELFDIPDVWYDMSPKNDIRPDLYTGKVSTTIPLYTYKDNDFEIPISVDYYSSGFKTNQPIGPVGLGWHLNVGGSISRIINGIADENERPNHIGFFNLVNTANITGNELLDQGKFFQRYSDEIPVFGLESFNRTIETTPDIFSFQFGNHKGNFCFGYDHSFHVFNSNHPAGEYKINVDIQNFTDYPESDNLRRLIFTITTGDGYIYTFDMGDVGRGNSSNLFCCSDFTNIYVVPAMEWPLVSIQAPNGRLVSFEYGAPESNASSRSFFAGIDWEGEEKHAVDCFDSSHYNGRLCWGYENRKQRYYSVKKITIDNIVIDLSYGNRIPEKTYHDHDHSNTDYSVGIINIPTVSKLDFISIKPSAVSSPLKTYSFEYSYSDTVVSESRVFSHGRPVLFLKKINIAGEGSYEMDYYDENSVFPLITEGSDHWGYYNYTCFQQNAIVEGTSPQYKVFHADETDSIAARMGMLQTLIRPTGGYSKYYYEPHTWDVHVSKDLTNDNKPYLSWRDFTAGGVRIKRVTEYTNPNDSTFREFTYWDLDTGLQTGILLHSPRYYRKVNVMWDRSSIDTINKSSTMRHRVVSPWYRDASAYGNFTYTQDQTHIAYSKVYENFPDESYIMYDYSDYHLLPDLEPDTTNKKPFVTILSSTPAFVDNFYTKYDSRHLQRGKLISKKYYSNQDKLLYSEEYQYNYSKDLKYIPTAEFAYSYVYLSKLFVDDYPLEKIIKTTYSTQYNENRTIQSKMFTYNNLGQIASTAETDINGKTQVVQYRYPFDIKEGADMAIFRKMTEKNIIADYVEKTASINEMVTSGEYRKFNEVKSGIFKPERMDILQLSAPLAYETLYPWTNTYSTHLNINLLPLLSSISKIEYLPYFNRPEQLKIIIQGSGEITIKKDHKTIVYSKTFNSISSIIEEVELPVGLYEVHLKRHNSVAYVNCQIQIRDRKTTMQGNSNLRPENDYQYDIKGNIVEIKQAGSNYSNTILWGYNYQYPIAEIQGANHAQVEAAIQGGQTTIDEIALSDILSTSNLSKINALRTSMPNALITTYTYKPLVGRLTETDPRGVITYYEYDDFGRLVAIKDENRNLIEKYKYHYKE